MAKCKDCIHFPICKPHTDPNESYPEVGGCPAFKNKDAFAEVVRCKDCKNLQYGYQCYCPLGMNLNNDGDAYVLVNEDDFCSCGERREGE